MSLREFGRYATERGVEYLAGALAIGSVAWFVAERYDLAIIDAYFSLCLTDYAYARWRPGRNLDNESASETLREHNEVR